MAAKASGNESVQVLGFRASLILMLLWLACLLSALGVVCSTYESRKATQALETLRREASSLKVMSGKYLLEKSSWAAYSRVERIATNDLGMQMPQPGKTVLVHRNSDSSTTDKKYISKVSRN
ncbi:MAG: cell division protein FtsL [Alteromonadaceae bacterium]|nr:MAG: cell division protein FtsL [Alteromonadaceae bacterium]